MSGTSRGTATLSNEFTNFDQGFGGMGTLLRVDPPGGCTAAPTSTAIVGGVLKSGSVTGLGADDSTYYQVNPKTTTRPTGTTAAQPSITVASAAGFPTSGSYYIRIDSEVLQVTGGQGTTTWTVARGQLGTAAAAHAQRRHDHRSVERLVRRVHRCPGRLDEPVGDATRGRTAATRPAPPARR